MNFKENLIAALVASTELEQKDVENLLSVPPDAKMGDYAFPCFRLGGNPKEAAENLAEKISLPEGFKEAKVFGPYLNFFVDQKVFMDALIIDVLEQKEQYGKQTLEKEKVMVEFSQPNTHKAFHIGHIRGTSLGESISRILEFVGKDVVRANYSGDTGMHVAKWLWGYLKFHKDEPLRKDEEWIASIYVDAVKRLSDDDEAKEEVRELNRKLDARDPEFTEIWKKTRQLSIDALGDIYKELDTHFDYHFFEGDLEEDAKRISRELVEKGVAKESQGAIIMDLEAYKMGVWVLLRNDGTTLYSSKDLALAEKKFNEFGIEKSIYVVGKEQELHFYQLFKTLELAGFKQAKDCTYVPVSLVKLPHGKMSSRTGDNVLYSSFKKELVAHASEEIKKRFTDLGEQEVATRAQAVAIASLKFSMLKQGINKEIVFDKHEALSFEGETGAYLLYSYARSVSIAKKAGDVGAFTAEKSGEVEEKEFALAKLIAAFPVKVEGAAHKLSPSLVAQYAIDLAKAFNEFYAACKVVGSEDQDYRVHLIKAYQVTLENCARLLGIPLLEQM